MTIHNETFFRPTFTHIHPVALHTPALPRETRRVAIDNNHLVMDQDGVCVHVIQDAIQHRVVDLWDSTDLLLLGIDPMTSLAFFSHDRSLAVFAYDLRQQRWIEDPSTADIDFPRFMLSDDAPHSVQVCVVDLETCCNHQFPEAVTPLPSSRQSA